MIATTFGEHQIQRRVEFALIHQVPYDRYQWQWIVPWYKWHMGRGSFKKRDVKVKVRGNLRKLTWGMLTVKTLSRNFSRTNNRRTLGGGRGWLFCLVNCLCWIFFFSSDFAKNHLYKFFFHTLLNELLRIKRLLWQNIEESEHIIR